MPKIWRQPDVVTISKLSKPLDYAKSCCLISLLCVPCKILERLIHTRVKPIDPFLPSKLASVRRGRSTLQQVTRMRQYIEKWFEHEKKTDAVFINLTAAYYTEWHSLKTPQPSA